MSDPKETTLEPAPVSGRDLRAELDQLIDAGLEFSTALNAFAARRDGVDLAFVQKARKDLVVEGAIEVDENAITSRGDDEEGTYCLAWVWVRADRKIKALLKKDGS